MTTALVIEDNDDNYVLASVILESRGIRSERAKTGLEGVEAARRLRPDVVLLDIQLPDIDGYEVLDRLKADAETADLPIVAVTSYAMAGDRGRILRAGCNGYIEKPIDPDIFVDQIMAVLERGDADTGC
jgi:CheY-like chemotaxis protein